MLLKLPLRLFSICYSPDSPASTGANNHSSLSSALGFPTPLSLLPIPSTNPSCPEHEHGSGESITLPFRPVSRSLGSADDPSQKSGHSSLTSSRTKPLRLEATITPRHTGFRSSISLLCCRSMAWLLCHAVLSTQVLQLSHMPMRRPTSEAEGDQRVRLP